MTVSEGRGGLGPGASPPPHLAGGRVFRQVWGAPAGASGCPGDQVCSRLCGHTPGVAGGAQVMSIQCSGAKARGKKSEGRGAAGPRAQGPSSSSSCPSRFPASRPAPVPQPGGPRGTWAPSGLAVKWSTCPRGAGKLPAHRSHTRVSCLLCSRAMPRASQATPHSPGSHLRENREAQRRTGAPVRE